MSVHTLDSPDIQADIARNGKIEVPTVDDPRFDRKIYDRFNHRDLIRVFIPMKVPSTGEIIGTVEAGYRRGYRDFIYETDIQFLQSFVAYVVEAIEPSKRALIEIISHELRSSIVGIRSNADYLRLLWQGLPPGKIYNKLYDTLADCEILLLNVGELEYFLGRLPQAPKIERISVVKDLIIKTVNQLTPLVKERRFDYRKIDYSKAASFSISIYAERAKLNQVVYNLLLNAIKYAEDDPAQFSIEIGVEDLHDQFVLSFADYGIGITEGLEEKIFEYAFRTDEAKAKNVTGSGLGLTIARERMRELGGNLVVTSNSKPTEFQVLIPKKLMEATS
jgi:two-component system sensor histidine kinase VicK